MLTNGGSVAAVSQLSPFGCFAVDIVSDAQVPIPFGTRWYGFPEPLHFFRTCLPAVERSRQHHIFNRIATNHLTYRRGFLGAVGDAPGYIALYRSHGREFRGGFDPRHDDFRSVSGCGQIRNVDRNDADL